MKVTGPTNIVLRKTIRELYKASRKYRAPIWRALAEELEKPRRKRRVVNISRINRYTREGDVVVVPGKVLGAGILDHKVTVAAIGFSKTALEKIRAVGGEAIHILELISRNPRGSNVKIIG
jgi:large subunit ribosomal protein L18e